MIPLSIIVPTKDRQRYCESTIRSILAFDEPFELVVQDSSADDALGRFCAAARDERLRFVKAPSTLGMTKDFERALSTFAGEYACMIGDDDGVTPALFEAVREASRLNADSVVSSAFSIRYNWPDVSSPYSGKAAAGRLFIGKLAPRASFAERGLDAEVDRFLATGGQGCGVLPRAYHGVVSRRLVERVRQRFGSCFAGVSPDVSFSFQAALASERHLEASWPLTISGTSGNSNAGRDARREHVGELWTDPHMKHYQGIEWPTVIPEFFSVETVWGQASYEVVSRAGDSYLGRFSLPALYALCLLRHRSRSVRET